MRTFLLNGLLLFGMFWSAQLALAWGEAATFPLHRDKSALSGFGAVMILMMVRWLCLAVVLGAAAGQGAFTRLPGGKVGQVLTVLTLHLVLGVLSLHLFNWVVEGIQADNPGPQRLAWLPGLALPILVFAVAFWALNREWVARRPWAGLVVLALLIWGHWAGWREGRYSPAPSASQAASEPE